MNGFNLTELCLCMSIMIILSSSGYYGYQHHKQTLDQKQAEIYLQDIALQLEEHQDPQAGYQNLSLASLGLSNFKNDYAFSLSTTNNSYIVNANPRFHDNCGSISLDQTGKMTSEKNCL